MCKLGGIKIDCLCYASGSPDSLVSETVRLWWWVVLALCRGHWSLTWRIFLKKLCKLVEGEVEGT